MGWVIIGPVVLALALPAVKLGWVIERAVRLWCVRLLDKDLKAL